MKFVLDKEWLLKNVNENNVRIVDCRFSLAEPEKGRKEYENSHIPGAVFFDLEKDFSGAVGEHGGRHPLPNVDEFVGKLEQAGIDEHTLVVAYDNGEGAYSARFWWLLHYLGHEKVYVLNGGFKGWNEANYPVSTDLPIFDKKDFQVNIHSELLADMEEVRKASLDRTSKVILIDSREEKRYLGIEEPIDKKAGHIPGAINKPWFEGLRDGQYKMADEQKQRFSEIDLEKQVIVYCGSGVTAVPNYLSLKEAGYQNVKLYVGSFSDWISFEENDVK
ncbi:sulfurtransferase [Neobacillus ginsengisoli]|uniref:Thiosulfate/3-mercaptopyruvate sulfurtransferase n=1 Tax=Neobacillus ginsengisoli TaxID=904295 RepID=A0ABT9XQF3_9BACI|nr:sulfurtransferase [Neobacillus ginsengisoli]MDQ0197581.1 thiosulfate/3-mercaptopyruvate sulfurtransferase [Neobacillus ginsengisoli]